MPEKRADRYDVGKTGPQCDDDGAWAYDLSPYPAPEDYEPVKLTDVPWTARTPREA